MLFTLPSHNYGNFEGFTHHHVAVRFWQAFNKFVAVGEPSEMDSLQIGICNKLWQAQCSHSTGVSIPGGFNTFQQVTEFVVGKNSTAAFHCMDAAAFAYFQDHLDLEVVNYGTITVNLALAALEGNSSHAIGLTHETYNTDDNDEFEDDLFREHNVASFSSRQSTGAA